MTSLVNSPFVLLDSTKDQMRSEEKWQQAVIFYSLKGEEPGRNWSIIKQCYLFMHSSWIYSYCSQCKITKAGKLSDRG